MGIDFPTDSENKCVNLSLYVNCVPQQVWEVVRVDPTVGGGIVMKGGANNLTQEEQTEPWSQFGLSLLGNATLM